MKSVDDNQQSNAPTAADTSVGSTDVLSQNDISIEYQSEPRDQSITRINTSETFPPQGGYPPGEFPAGETMSDEERKGKIKEKKRSRTSWVDDVDVGANDSDVGCFRCIERCLDGIERCLDGPCACLDFHCNCGDCDCGDCDCGDCDCDCDCND